MRRKIGTGGRWLLAALLLGACGGGEREASDGGIDRSCVGDDECPSGEVCFEGTCTPEGDVPAPDMGPPCEDLDGDGYGPNCGTTPDDPRNMDCDPQDPMLTGVEVCDGADNDCDPNVDEGVLSACGNCDPDCDLSGVGPGGGTGEDGFDIDDDGGLALDEDGAIILDSQSIETTNIWIANTGEGTVSKFETEAPYREIARYSTGPDDFRVFVGGTFATGGNDPSRTSVNTRGDAFVANRSGNDLTYISGLGLACPDTNGDGVITTSTDVDGDGFVSRAEVLPFGEDDCVVSRSLDDVFPGERFVRAAAAQDVTGLDGFVHRYIWVGGFQTRRIAKFEVVEEPGGLVTLVPRLVTDAPFATYGFALDGRGVLWIASLGSGQLGFIDTNICLDDASCDVDFCTAPDSESPACDAAIKGSIPTPVGSYGITVDFNQRVWIGGAGVARFDPAAPSGSRWVVSRDGSGDGPGGVNGIAADAAGWIWGAALNRGVYRIFADDPSRFALVSGTDGVLNKGMAVAADGNIWSITMGTSTDDVTSTSQALVIAPGVTFGDEVVQRDVASSIFNSYTYSDMTGLQLRLATAPQGSWSHVFEGCDPATTEDGLTRWSQLRFDADVPPGTQITFRFRTARNRARLEVANWVTAGRVPGVASPIELSMRIARELELMRINEVGNFLEIEAVLESTRASVSEVVTPRLRGVEVVYTCPPRFG
ncbi:MAG: hypothetical protein AAGH15_11750 [Myxococcota bacterium]